MSVVRNAMRGLRARLSPQARWRLDRAAYAVLYGMTPARHLHFFNAGYAPLSPRLLDVPQLAGEPYQRMLYELVARGHIDGLHAAPLRILEIGSGLGGGLLYLAALYPGAQITGLDTDEAACRLARKRAGAHAHVEVVAGNGTRLPFEAASFDLVVSVGTASYVGIEAFTAEAARVTAPGGLISFSAGFTDAPVQRVRWRLNELGKASGLKLARFADITANVVDALHADTPRRERLVRFVPPPFRSYAREWADLPGTRRYQQFEAGRRTEFAAVWRKPA